VQREQEAVAALSEQKNGHGGIKEAHLVVQVELPAHHNVQSDVTHREQHHENIIDEEVHRLETLAVSLPTASRLVLIVLHTFRLMGPKKSPKYVKEN
jgi:hypothetical protein